MATTHVVLSVACSLRAQTRFSFSSFLFKDFIQICIRFSLKLKYGIACCERDYIILSILLSVSILLYFTLTIYTK